MARTDRTGQQYPTFALLATLSGRPFSSPQGGDAERAAIFPAVAPEKSDQPGVLGNLPRSRPGQRSEKRTGTTRASAASASKPAAQPRPAAKRTAATAARKRKAATTARKSAAGNRKTAPRERPAPQPASSG